jgi:hypothetical protein
MFDSSAMSYLIENFSPAIGVNLKFSLELA